MTLSIFSQGKNWPYEEGLWWTVALKPQFVHPTKYSMVGRIHTHQFTPEMADKSWIKVGQNTLTQSVTCCEAVKWQHIQMSNKWSTVLGMTI